MEGSKMKRETGAMSGAQGRWLRRGTVKRFGVGLVAGAVGFGVTAGRGVASDGVPVGRWAVRDGGGVLREFNPVGGESDGKSLDYTIIERVRLTRRERYCVAMSNKSQRYGHHAETYLLEMAFQSEDGQRRRRSAGAK